MTTATALLTIERAAIYRPDLREALTAVRDALTAKPAPKPRAKRKPKTPAWVKALDRKPGFGLSPNFAGYQRTEYLKTFGKDSAKQAKRLAELPAYPEFNYDPPKRLKDDERLTIIRAILERGAA